MSFYSQPATYNSLLGDESIPATLLPSTQSKMIPARAVLKSVTTSTGNIGAGSSALWSISTGAASGYLKPNSCYLRCNVTVTQTGGAGVTWKFKGPDGLFNSSALINRLTVNCGSTQASQLTNYNIWHDLLLAHASSDDYVKNDALLYEFTGATKLCTTDLAINKTISVCIPLISGIFTSQQAIPLFLMNSPITVEVLFNSINAAFATATNPITAYQLTNAEIIYEEIAVSQEYKNSLLEKMRGGMVWRQYIDSVYSVNTASQSTLSYNVGVNVGSCKGVLMTEVLDTDIATVAQNLNFNANGFSNLRLSYDGQLVNQFNLNNSTTTFSELNRALNAIYDSNVTSSIQPVANLNVADGAMLYSNYCTEVWGVGLSTQAVNDFSVSFSGQPVQMVNFLVEHATPAINTALASPFPGSAAWVAGQIYFFILYDELLTIDASGQVNLVRS